jgi:hypothetical protein
MENKKIIVLILIVLLIIVFITLLSDTCNTEYLESSNTIVPFNAKDFLNNDPSNNNTFDLLGYKFTVLSNPTNLTVDNNTGNYVIHNTDPSNNNIMLVGHLDIKDEKIGTIKAFVLFIINNIIIEKDASGNVEPSFINYGFILNDNPKNSLEFNNNILTLNTVNYKNDDITVRGSTTNTDSKLFIGTNALYSDTEKSENILVKYEYMANSLRPSYNNNYNMVINSITLNMVDLLKKKYT